MIPGPTRTTTTGDHVAGHDARRHFPRTENATYAPAVNLRLNLHRPTLAVLIPISLAVVSISAAWVHYRAGIISGDAGGAARAGIIDSVKRNAFNAENSLFLGQEALVLRRYLATSAEQQVLKQSGGPAGQAAAAAIDKYLVPVYTQNTELVSDPRYRLPGGNYDLDARLKDLTGNDVPDPAQSFEKASSADADQRWMAAVAVLMTFPLFWLTLSELTKAGTRRVAFLAGSAFYLASLALYGLIEFGEIA